MAGWLWRQAGEAFELRVRVTPKSARDAVEGVAADAAGQSFLRVRVRAAPEKGRANEAVESLLARELGVPPSAVSVEKGESQRTKTVRIAAGPDTAKRLAALTGETGDG